MPNSRSRLTRGAFLSLFSTLVGITLAAVVAGPASAVAPPAAAPPTTPPPAVTTFESQTSIAAPTKPAATPALGTHLVTPASLQGERQTFTRGGSLAWVSDTFEWYWNGAAMSSSTGYQAVGYAFPNTVTPLGITRTLKVSSEHLWRASASIGTGVVTPWGAVVVYSQTVTDYFTLTPGKLTHSNN